MNIKQMIRDVAAVCDIQVLPEGTLVYVTDEKTIRMHDGTTPGGAAKFLSEEDYITYSSLHFTAVQTESTPGVIATIGNKLIEFTVLGTYELPALATVSIGTPVWLSATVDDVVIEFNGSEQVLDHGVASASIAMTQHEIICLTRKTGSRWLILNRY